MTFKLPNVLVDTIAVGLVLLVTGCTIIPAPLTQEEIQQRVQADLERVDTVSGAGISTPLPCMRPWPERSSLISKRGCKG